MGFMKPVPKDGEWNGDMLKLALALRGVDAGYLAKLINRDVELAQRWIDGERPNREDLGYIVKLTDFPEGFFFREGEVFERDPRYPVDMFVPLSKRPPITHADVAALVPLIPEERLAELCEIMHEMAVYADNVKRLPQPKAEDK